MNVVSFSIGLSSCIIALLFINYSLSFDNFHNDTDRIYKVIKRVRGDNVTHTFFGTNGIEANEIAENYPQVESYTRVMREPLYVSEEGNAEKRFVETAYIVDPGFFKIFSCPLITGSSENVLLEPYTIIISGKTAKKLFNDENPVGKRLRVTGYYLRKEYTVTGIFKDFPDNSIFNATLITCENSEMPGWLWENWNFESSYVPVDTYIKLRKGTDYKEVEKNLEKMVQLNYPVEMHNRVKYLLQKFNRIYLFSQQDFGEQFYSNINYVYIFAGLALFILIISSVNFINLTTGRLLLRAKEIGIKKAFGTGRSHIYLQFVFESLLILVLTLPVSVYLVYLILPFFQHTLNIYLNVHWMLNFRFISRALILVLLIAIFTGSVSAFSFAWITPASVLQDRLKIGSRRQVSQKAMFIIQYTLSVILISVSVVFYLQLKYMMNKDLGYDKENKIILPIFSGDEALRENYRAVKEEFLKNPDILSASASHFLIGSGGEVHKVMPEGMGSKGIDMAVLAVDEDFIETYGLTLIRGRNFSGEISSDRTGAFILNEAAVKELNWDNPIGKQFAWQYGSGKVIGVVKDFSVAEVSKKIEPLVMCMWVPVWNFLTVRYKTMDYDGLIKFLEEKFALFAPGLPFRYQRFDELTDRTNLMFIETLNNTSLFFSLIAILIACIGLFGLASFSASQRIKEIGIRKTNGATSVRIAYMLMKAFLKWVIVACILGLPLGWYFSRLLLSFFSVRINLSPWIFLVAGVIAVLIAILTVSIQAIRSSNMNPVDALKYE